MAKEKKIKQFDLPEPPEMDSNDFRKGGSNFLDFYQTERFDYTFLKNKVQYINHSVYGTDAATATNYGVFFIAPFPCVVLSVRESHGTAGTDGSAVGLNIEKLSGTEALGSGDDVLSSDLDLKGTANTVQEGTMTKTLANRNLIKNERLALKDSGTLTSVADVAITIEILYN